MVIATRKPPRKRPPPVDLDTLVVGLKDAQRLIGKSETYVLSLVKNGFLKRVGIGQYRVADVAQAALKFRESEDRQSSQTAEAKRVPAARAAEIELRTAKATRDVIPMDEVSEFLEEAIGAFSAELVGVPVAATRDLALRAGIESNINGALQRLKAKFDDGKAAVRDRRPLIADEGDSDD